MMKRDRTIAQIVTRDEGQLAAFRVMKDDGTWGEFRTLPNAVNALTDETGIDRLALLEGLIERAVVVDGEGTEWMILVTRPASGDTVSPQEALIELHQRLWWTEKGPVVKTLAVEQALTGAVEMLRHIADGGSYNMIEYHERLMAYEDALAAAAAAE